MVSHVEVQYTDTDHNLLHFVAEVLVAEHAGSPLTVELLVVDEEVVAVRLGA